MPRCRVTMNATHVESTQFIDTFQVRLCAIAKIRCRARLVFNLRRRARLTQERGDVRVARDLLQACRLDRDWLKRWKILTRRLAQVQGIAADERLSLAGCRMRDQRRRDPK